MSRRATSTPRNAERAARFPRNLLVTQTHDTKRSGDVRARIGALASMPDAFAAPRAALALRLPLADVAAARPTPVEQLFIFQTLLGVWPISEERLRGVPGEGDARGQACTRPGSTPNEAHEAAVQTFARALFTHRDFLRTFEPFQREVAEAGDRAALGQLLLKLTVPGVPDIYQGDELLCLSLVDPDNRRPVDWEARRAALARPAAEAAGHPARARAARALPEAFAGAYEPVDAGPDIVAFTARRRRVRRGRGCAATASSPRPDGDWAVVLELDGLGVLLSRR